MPRKDIATIRFQYCTTESVGVLSRFRCLLQIRGRCSVDSTSSERVKPFSYMRSTSTRWPCRAAASMVALVPKVPLRKQSLSTSEVCHGVPQTIVLVCVSQLHSSSLEVVVFRASESDPTFF